MTHRMLQGLVAVGMSGLLGAAIPVNAAEHGGKEHGGTTQEHGGQAVKAEPSAEQIRQTIQNHVQGIVRKESAFTINDPVTGTQRTLDFVRVHERVGKTGGLYYSCTDMRDQKTGQLLDLDFDVKAEGEGLRVIDTRIHKVDGNARYTYDGHDNRIPVKTDR